MTAPVLAHDVMQYTPRLPGAVGTGVVLVATDGSPSSEVALTAAEIIARHTGSAVEAISALEPVTAPLLAPELAGVMGEAQMAEESRRVAQLEAQVARHAGDAGEWPLLVRHGRPASVVSRAARERNAALVVTGFGAHGIVSRMFGTETPLAIARSADVPVLCVPAGFARMPRVVVVGVDFGNECLRAAAAVRPLLDEATHVYLVHVKPKDRLDMPVDVSTTWEHMYELETQESFQRVTETLGLRPDVGVTTAVLRGAPARELLDFTAAVRADLLVAGHGHRGRWERLAGGSVASALFRGAQCALLLAPHGLPVAMLPSAPRESTELLLDRTRWPFELRRFAERNTGRMATVEVDDVRLGAQIVARNYPFVDADYDWRDDSVELSFGEPEHGRGHLTHVIRGPVSVAIYSGADGRDLVLRIAREEGQTLLSLHSDR